MAYDQCSRLEYCDVSSQWKLLRILNYLNGANNGNNWPAQMTDEWVDAVLVKLRDANKHDVANAIADAKRAVPPKLTKIVTVVDRTPAGNASGLTGGINILKVQ